jgi:hypothetical protein
MSDNPTPFVNLELEPAIALRSKLRDIKGGGTKLSPVSAAIWRSSSNLGQSK